MKGEKNVKDCLRGYNCLVKNDSGDLGMAGLLRANFLIAGVLGVATGVANFYVLNAGKLHKA